MGSTGSYLESAVIVTRVSTLGQEDGTSPDVQLAACRSKAAKLNVRVHAEYHDTMSGACLRLREGMQAALADIEARRATILITAKVDRTGRDLEHLQTIKKQVMNAGGRLVFADLDIDLSTPAGGMLFGVLGSFAEYERQEIRRRTMSGHRAMAEAGITTRRTFSPFGYCIVSKAHVLSGRYPADQLGKFVIVEDEAETVRRIFSLYVNEGKSLMAIAKLLNNQAVKTARGARLWQATTLRSILTNPVHKGQPAVYKRVHRSDENHVGEINPHTGRPIKNPKYSRANLQEDWITLSAPAIVGEDTWDAAQRRLSSARKALGGNPKRIRMLAGRIVCSVCGGGMAVRRAGGGYQYYTCTHQLIRRINSGSDTCDKTNYPIPLIEAATIRAIVEASERPEAITAAKAAYRQQVKTPSTAGELRNEIAAIDFALSEIKVQEAATVQAQIAGIMAGGSPDAYASAFADLAARRKDLEDRRGSLTATLRTTPVQHPTRDEMPNVWHERAKSDLVLALTDPCVENVQKRQLIGNIVESVRPQKDGAEIIFLAGAFGEDETLHRFKVPFSLRLGLINVHSLPVDALLAPAVVAGALFGRWVLPRIDQNVFNSVALALTLVAAVKLLF